jgi:hypothetical protein
MVQFTKASSGPTHILSRLSCSPFKAEVFIELADPAEGITVSHPFAVLHEQKDLAHVLMMAGDEARRVTDGRWGVRLVRQLPLRFIARSHCSADLERNLTRMQSARDAASEKAGWCDFTRNRVVVKVCPYASFLTPSTLTHHQRQQALSCTTSPLSICQVRVRTGMR